MHRFFDRAGRWIAGHPWVCIAMVAIGTAVAAVGLTLTVDQADPTDAFLPSSSELVAAQEELAESFPDSASLESIQVVLRGDVLSAAGADDSLRATMVAANDPGLTPYAVSSRQPVSPGHLISAILAGPEGDPASVDLTSVTDDEIDAALATAATDEFVAVQTALLASLVSRDADGPVVGGIGVITVNAGDDLAGLEEAQVALDEVVEEVPLNELESARTLSNGKSNQESDDASATSLAILMLIALVVIGILLALFYRQVSDVALSLAGLVLTIVWALGFQGLLGPDGLGLIGAPSVLGQMVPVMMIGLCVDYGIQFTSRYREELNGAADDVETSAARSVGASVGGVMLPLGLAGATTSISFLTNLTGDISGLGDFGVVAASGVASGLFIFLTGVPSARLLLDRRREAKGRAIAAKPIADALPITSGVVERIGATMVRRPAVMLAGAGIITIAFGSLATQLESTFDSNDLLPDGTESTEDIRFLDDFLGGNTEPVTVLVEAELSNDRTLRNLLDFSSAIEDPVTRPDAVSSEVTASLGVVVDELPPESHAELDELAVELANPLLVAPVIVEDGLDIVRDANPGGYDAGGAEGVIDETGAETDRTIIQFDALTGDTDDTRDLFNDVDALWFGEPEEITAIANEIIGIEVADSLTESQSTSIMLTVIAALIVLILFFWVTEFRPMLAVLSVLPIVMVLVWVLGTMVLLGYDYNVFTALITALSIGIGVDYTIHVTHRFLEEREHTGDIEAAVHTTLNTTGGALVGSALTTALGFIVLLFSPIGPIGQFGTLTAITVVYSLLAAVIVLPPMLVIWAAYHDWRQGSGLVDAEIDEPDPAPDPEPEPAPESAPEIDEPDATPDDVDDPDRELTSA